MADEPRDEADQEEPGPPPATWAGRQRAEGEPVEPAPSEHETGITEDFEGIEAELSAEFDRIGTEEHAEHPAGEEPTEVADEPDADDAEEVDEVDEADEQEEPPDEFEFTEAEDGGEEQEPEAGDEQGAEATAEDAEGTAGREEAAEAAKAAAHAGLAARAQKQASQRSPASVTQSAVAAAVAKPAVDGAGEPPKRTVWWRFVAASFVIVASVAAATAVAFLLLLDGIGDKLGKNNAFADARAQLSEVEGGGPQTILILGSDKRSGTPGDPGRSDTALLLRVDPDKRFLSLMSLPRDLKVPIPGYGTDRLNAAYFYGEREKAGGGTELTVKAIKEYLGIPINHIVNVDFEGFYEAVNAIDCVYIDVDRHYFNSNEGVALADYYAEIDVPAGYSKLCGYTALQYVRYRHNDNDLVRGARQQAFIREARQRIPPRELLPIFGSGNELIDIFTDNTTSDISDAPTIIEMLKTFVEVRNASVRQITLGELTDDGGVAASKEQIEAAVTQFLGEDIDESGERDRGVEPKEPKKPVKDQPEGEAAGPAMVDATGQSQPLADKFARFMAEKKAGLPIIYPTRIVANSAAAVTDESRAGLLAGPEDKNVFEMYKFVVSYQEGFGLSYYGISGVNWSDPPILNNPSETRTVDGREYLLFYERDKLRLVGWKTGKGSYWVNNTLTHALSEDEMLALAASTKELGD
ncbi:MAG: LCP family protein [Actinomycetota bacterium]|nr:LCP family protein [Actinomycetota bacterium]